MSHKVNTSNTVLIVDDTPSNLQVLFTYLENAGFSVLLAQSGKRALKIVNSLTKAHSQAPHYSFSNTQGVLLQEGKRANYAPSRSNETFSLFSTEEKKHQFLEIERSAYEIPPALLPEQERDLAWTKQNKSQTVPDLILLDVLMPDIDGFEICRQLKSRKDTREIPVIFLTALSETNHKIKGFAVGGVDYITKPIARQEVIARITTHLALRNMRQHLLDRNQELQTEISRRRQIDIELQQALNSKATIERITERIRDSLDEKQVLTIVTQELVQMLGLDRCQIEFYDRNNRDTTTSYSEVRNLSTINEGGEIRAVDSFIEQFANSKYLHRQLAQKISLQFVTPIAYKALANKPLTCLVCPIFDNREPINIMGNLWLCRPPEKFFNIREIKLVEQIANQCAIAIRQARLYQASQLQVAELARLNHLKNDFLKTISHELRSPMSRIQLAVQTLEKLLATESQSQSAIFQRVLTIFRQSCSQQNQLVDNLLTLCHLDARAETIAMDWIDLPTWIPQVVRPFEEQAENQKQQLIVEIDSNIAPLYSDSSTLARIVRELIDNACKYTPAEKAIYIIVTGTEDTINLSIHNSGTEIPAEERERIFERFYRIPNNDPWQHGGTGLGLHLVKKLLELIHGQISLESAAEVTKFTIELPRLFR